MATTPVFLPGESHGQRSLEGYSPSGCEELDMTYNYHFHLVRVVSGDLSSSEGINDFFPTGGHETATQNEKPAGNRLVSFLTRSSLLLFLTLPWAE